MTQVGSKMGQDQATVGQIMANLNQLRPKLEQFGANFGLSVEALGSHDEACWGISKHFLSDLLQKIKMSMSDRKTHCSIFLTS